MSEIGLHVQRLAGGTNDELIAELTPGMLALLHERAQQYYYGRIWQAFVLGPLLGFSLIQLFPVLNPLVSDIGRVALLAALAYFAFGFALIWPERWERSLLQKEIDHRRLYGKWRWDR